MIIKPEKVPVKLETINLELPHGTFQIKVNLFDDKIVQRCVDVTEGKADKDLNPIDYIFDTKICDKIFEKYPADMRLKVNGKIGYFGALVLAEIIKEFNSLKKSAERELEEEFLAKHND